jgi:hypothetical protein
VASLHNIVVTAHARSRRHPHQPVQCYTLALPSREKAFASAPSRTVLPPGPWHGRTNGSDRYTPHQHGQQQRGDQLQRRTRLKAFQMVPEDKRSFFEFSLCFSRVCPGKMFGFIYKWLKKTVFTRHTMRWIYQPENCSRTGSAPVRICRYSACSQANNRQLSYSMSAAATKHSWLTSMLRLV